MPTITITVNAAAAARISAAVQRRLGLASPATIPEVKQYIIQILTGQVRDHERVVAAEAADNNPIAPGDIS